MDETKHHLDGTGRASTFCRRVLKEHGRSVLRHLRVLGVPEIDLDDALQDVFLVVAQGLDKYEERGRMRAWLYSISTRVAWSLRRKQRRRPEDLVSDPEVYVAPTQLDHVVDREALALGHQLLASLPPAQREVFWLYEVEELKMPEIARILGCPLQTAYSRLNRARERVLSAVKQAAAPEPMSA